MELKELQQKLFDAALKEGIAESEIYYSGGNSFQASIFKGEVSEYKNEVSFGLSIRGVSDGQMGYAYSERCDEQVIPLLIKSVKDNASIIEEKQPERLFKGSESYPEIVKKQSISLTAEEKINMAKRMEAHALAHDKRITSVVYCIIASEEGGMGIANSLGLSLSHNDTYSLALLYLQAQENEQVKVAGKTYISHDFSDFNPESFAEEVANRALSYLGAKTVHSNKYPVIFENSAAAELLTAFTDIFYAEQVQKGFSMVKSKQDENGMIASGAVTIRDDYIHENSVVNVPFDSEGVAARNKAVIENGVLKTLLYNLKSAEKDGIDSTGNGFKSSFKSTVNTACTNFYIEPSKICRDDLFMQMNNGLFITELAGLHSGTNLISGDFSLSADGFLIENGKIARPVEQITIAGNFYDLLRDIQAVGSDLYFDLPRGSSAIGSPSLFIKELAVAGGDE